MSQPQPPTDPAHDPNQHPTAQSQYSQAPYGQPQPAQPTRQGNKNRRAISIAIAILAVAVVGVIIGVATGHRGTPAKEATAGQCIQDPEGKSTNGTDTYVVDCDSDEAAYKVTAPAGTDCTTVEGTTTTYLGLCMIGVDEDPATALNSVQEGDCLDIDASTQQATASECTTGTYPVLKVLTDVSDTDLGTVASASSEGDACRAAGVDEDAYTSWYKWNFSYFESDSAQGLGNLTGSDTNDFVFCLGDPQS
ncbi:hypothetical protein [Actinomyces sp. MRS3W]|uniref:hypothetical protein n=1 Tax=Actinomyces sp. MRS3W TaxID=2800796 RepID=UPI0028FDC3BC|nr:hypothetical protein [Actinomyces sp. MRS3W]MDU0348586.1 hypothetical protein [Actinomyces sp. MRS3W]